MIVLELSLPVRGILLVLLILASSVWLGGAAGLIVVARSTSATLTAADRVAFFRHLGRRWGIVGTAALLVAYACGLVLLLAVPWTALSTWSVAVAVLLALALAVGIVKARRMTRLRRAAGSSRESVPGARAATALRAGIVLLSVVLVALAVAQSLSA